MNFNLPKIPNISVPNIQVPNIPVPNINQISSSVLDEVSNSIPNIITDAAINSLPDITEIVNTIIGSLITVYAIYLGATYTYVC
jgi:hypothetical protein